MDGDLLEITRTVHYDQPMRAYKYKRISNDPEGLELGVTRQDEDTDKLAERLGATVVGSFTDNDVSASTLSSKPRPEYDRMLAEARAGGCDAILAYSNSRLTRRPSEWDDLLELYRTHKVEIHTVVSGSANFATADGRAVARTIAAWDAAEAERIGERVKRTLEQNAKRGDPHGGTRAYGWEADRITPIPAEVAVINEMADRVISGESLHSIIRDLKDRGVRSATGGDWTRVSMRRMLMSPRLVGVRQHGINEYPARWDGVLNEVKWRHARTILAANDGNNDGNNARVSLLAGLALCGECGKKMTMKNGGSNARYYCPDCRLMRLRDVVDFYVERVIIHLLEQGFSPAPPLPPSALKKLEDLRTRIMETEAAFVEGDSMPPREYVSTIRKMRQRLVEEERALFPAQPLRAVKVMGADAEGTWAGLSLDLRRKVLDDLAEVRLHRALKGRRGFDPATVEIIPKH